MILSNRAVQFLFLSFCMFAVTTAVAATYTIPGGPLPPGCTFDSGQATVQCPGNLILGNNDNIVVSAPTTLQIGSDFTFGNNFNVNVGGSLSDLDVLVAGNLNPGNGATINASLGVQGNVNAANNAEYDGAMVVSGNLTLGNNSVVTGGVDVSGTLNTGQNVTVNGTVQASSVNLGQNNEINGDIEAENVNINGSNTVVDGNINATGSVNNNGTVTGYINASTVNNNGDIDGPVCDLNENVGGCNGGSAPQPQFYRLTHSGTAPTCQSEPVLIEACGDANCSTTLPITGQVTVQAQGPEQYSANASFAESGQASVSLALTSAGAYTLSVSAAEVAPISGQTQCQSPDGCTITAVDTALQFSRIGSQVAGAPFQAELQIIRTDDNTGACQLVADTIDEIELALSCLNPDQCVSGPAQNGATLFRAQDDSLSQHPVFTSVPASFDAQSTLTLNLNHQDVGQVRIHARGEAQNGAMLQGASNPFVVRPAGFSVQVDNPVSYTGDIFARAGDSLQVMVQAFSASGDPTPSFGNEVPPQVPTLASSADTTTPAEGVDGTVLLHTALTQSTSIAGAFTSDDVRYTEAGTARFEAVLQAPAYLDSEPVSSWSEPVGRFVPYEFELDSSMLMPACTSDSPGFTYFGQPFDVYAEVLAQNYMGNLTVNYPDIGTGDSMQFLAFDPDEQSDLSDRLSPDAIMPDWNNGVGSITAGELSVERGELGAPEAPVENLQLAILLDPQTAVGASIPMAQADTSHSGPDCAQDQLCNARRFASPHRWVYGRLLLSPTYGSEFDSLPIIASAQVWNGERFIRHRADSCTSLDPDKITITDNPDNLPVQAIGSDSALREGDSQRDQFRFNAPEQRGEIDFYYDAAPWLRFGGEDNMDRPSASATFGTYSGHDRIYSWQEIHN